MSDPQRRVGPRAGGRRRTRDSAAASVAVVARCRRALIVAGLCVLSRTRRRATLVARALFTAPGRPPLTLRASPGGGSPSLCGRRVRVRATPPRRLQRL